MENRLIDELITNLCDYFVSSHEFNKQRWGWGEGLIAYTLLLWNKGRYFDYVKKYIDYHIEHGMIMDCSDRIAPTLASNELYKITKEEKYSKLNEKALDYITSSEKLIGDIPNHFGTSTKEKDYPLSIWVDSLMMFSVYTSIIGKETNNQYWIDFASRQPVQFAKLLASKQGSWYHAYWVKEKTHYPKTKLFWGRGNGWACMTLPMIVDNTRNTKEFESIKTIYKSLIDGVLKYQCKDGSFRTILNRAESYKETSATALIAGGIYKAVSLNMLDSSYLGAANKAYDFCIRNIEVNKDSILFKNISGPTVPLHKFPGPYIWYLTRKRKANYNYGVASLILATIYKKECK